MCVSFVSRGTQSAAGIGERSLLSSSQTQFVRTISILSWIVPSFHDFTRFLISNEYLYIDDVFDWVSGDHVLIYAHLPINVHIGACGPHNKAAGKPTLSQHKFHCNTSLEVHSDGYECILSRQIQSGHGQVMAVHACIWVCAQQATPIGGSKAAPHNSCRKMLWKHEN